MFDASRNQQSLPSVKPQENAPRGFQYFLQTSGLIYASPFPGDYLEQIHATNTEHKFKFQQDKIDDERVVEGR